MILSFALSAIEFHESGFSEQICHECFFLTCVQGCFQTFPDMFYSSTKTDKTATSQDSHDEVMKFLLDRLRTLLITRSIQNDSNSGISTLTQVII